MNEKEKEGIYLNGRAQVIDMLKVMAPEEKAKLLKNIKIRNPSIAQELSEQSFSFNTLNELDDNALSKIFNSLNPSLTGLAIKDTPLNFQRRVLSLLTRESAEKAYSVLRTNLDDEPNKIKRARQNVLTLATELYRKKMIQLV